jgi:carbamate kinase
MGYMIGQSFQNKLIRNGIKRDVVTIPAQIIVDKDDPSIKNPAKYVGPFYQKDEVVRLAKERNWLMKEDKNRGWRRVVPSPKPIRIVEKNIIRGLFNQGTIVITTGGGGIPIYIEKDGTYEGVDGVIDKDLASAILAIEIGANELYILTAVEKVYIDYTKPTQKALDRITVAEAKKYLAEGQFPPGSMKPKIEAAIQFLESGGEIVIITSVEKHLDAMKGETGTSIVPLI